MGKGTSKKNGKSKKAADGSAGEDQQPGLEGRRKERRAQLKAVKAAELEVTRLEQDLENNTIAVRQQESAMEAATARVADLEKAIKKSTKQRKQLRTALKEARAEAARARETAVAAEEKYDKAVLKEVVRREKAADLTVHPA